MHTDNPQTHIRFTLELSDIPAAVRDDAERKAKEAYVMELLRHGSITSGRAARLLGIARLDAIALAGEYGISLIDDPQSLEGLQQEVDRANAILG